MPAGIYKTPYYDVISCNVDLSLSEQMRCIPIIHDDSLHTSSAATAAFMYQYAKATKCRDPNAGCKHPSRLFINYNATKLHHDKDDFLGNCLKGIDRHGVCLESAWPYHKDHLHKRPSHHAYHEARACGSQQVLPEIIKTDCHLERIRQTKAAINNNQPVGVSLKMIKDYQKEHSFKKDAIIHIPDHHKLKEDGHHNHSFSIIGYDDRCELFKIRGHDGHKWGHHGYAYIPYHYLLEHHLAGHLWTLDIAGVGSV